MSWTAIAQVKRKVRDSVVVFDSAAVVAAEGSRLARAIPATTTAPVQASARTRVRRCIIFDPPLDHGARLRRARSALHFLPNAGFFLPPVPGCARLLVDGNFRRLDPGVALLHEEVEIVHRAIGCLHVGAREVDA